MSTEKQSDEIAALVAKQDECEKTRHRLNRELVYAQSRRRVSDDPKDMLFNEQNDKTVAELDAQIQKSIDEWNSLAARIGLIQQAEKLRLLVESTPTGDEKKDLAHLKALEANVKELRKNSASAEAIADAETAVKEWPICCENRKLLESFNEICEKQFAPLMNKMFLLRSNAPQRLRDLFDEQSTSCSHPLLSVNGLAIQFFPPESYTWQAEGKFGTGRKLWHWFPCAQ